MKIPDVGNIKLGTKATSMLLFLAVFLFFNCSVRFLGTTDGYPTRHLPVSIIQQGSFNLKRFILEKQEEPNALQERSATKCYSIVYANGSFVSKYPVLPAIMALPVYSISALLGIPFTEAVIGSLAKIAASLVAAFSTVLVYFVLNRFISKKWSVFLALSFALATSTWTIASQDLWQHGNSQLFLILTVYLLLKAKNSGWLYILAGLSAGLAFAARPLNFILITFLSLFILQSEKKFFLQFVFGALLPAFLLAIYNTYFFGLPWATGYGKELIDGWSSPLFNGFAGLLFSPSRGLFFFSPFLVFALYGIYLIWRRSLSINGELKKILRWLSLGIGLYFLILAKWWAWSGAHSYGPRMLTDIIPLLILFLIPLVKEKLHSRKILFSLFILLVSFSLLVQAVGILFYDGEYQGNSYTDSKGRERLSVWTFKDGQLYYYLNHAFHYLPGE